MSLRLRLSLAFVFVVLAPLLLAALLLSRGVPGFGGDAARQRVATAATAVSHELEERCTLAGTVANTVAYESTTSSREAVVDAVFGGGVSYAAILSPSGADLVHAGVLPATVQSLIDAKGSALALGSCADSGGTTPFAVVSRAELPRAGAGWALVAVTLDDATLKSWQNLAGGDVTLVSGGQVIATTASPGAAARYAAAAGRAVAQGKVIQVHGQLLSDVGAGAGRPVTVVVTASPGLGMTSLTSTLLAVLAAAVVLAVGLGWQLARVTTRPLTELALAARRIADGDLDTPVPDLGGGDEISQLAGAFEEMTGELRRSIGALHDSREELRHNLARLGDTLSGTHDLNRILHVILETAMSSVRAQAGAIYLPHSGGGARGDLFQRAGFGVSERGAAHGSRLKLGEGVLGLVAATGEAVRGRVGPGPGELHVTEEEPSARSLIAVPLRASGRVTGVLGLYDKETAGGSGSFNRGDLETIRTFASQATVAIDNVLLHQEAQRLSITDGLTGLWNYRYFTMTFAKEIERSSRFGRPLALLLLDLDKFKDVNDHYGHQRGDSVLIELATRVKAEIREVDTLARYGGEEFVLVLPETDAGGAAGAAQRICEVVRHRPFSQEGEDPLAITVSVGVSVFPTHGSTAATLMRNADTALYAAKDAGRDGWRMASDLEVAQHD
jgi:two-component system, cell cycle response regulator